MRLTTKGRYAVTAMIDIGHYGARGPVSVLEIAARQGISSSYLEQLIGRLKRSGYLSSLRGPGGGYVLACDPTEVSVSDIVGAVGEGVDATRCQGAANCQSGHMCLTHNLWVDLSAEIDRFLQSISLAKLIGELDSQQDQKSLSGGSERIVATLINTQL